MYNYQIGGQGLRMTKFRFIASRDFKSINSKSFYHLLSLNLRQILLLQPDPIQCGWPLFWWYTCVQQSGTISSLLFDLWLFAKYNVGFFYITSFHINNQVTYAFSITSWIQAIFYNLSPLSNINLILLKLNCNKITFKWTMGHIANLTNSSYQYTHLHKAMIIQKNNHYLLFENYMVLTCNKMCLWNTNAPR